MKNYLRYFPLFCLIVFGCHRPASSDLMEKWKAEIVAVESAFNDMAQREGLDRAFEFYVAEDGVINRDGQIIQGKEAIGKWYAQSVRPGTSLTWSPSFVEVSQSGDMAYTYGDFTFTFRDSLGQSNENSGIFHTVWKRQADGSWKFVWD